MPGDKNKTFVLRIDAQTMEALEAWAEDEFRSINGQLQWIIADALRRSGRLKKSRLRAAAASVPADDAGTSGPASAKASSSPDVPTPSESNRK